MQQVYIFNDYNNDKSDYKVFGIGHEIWTHDYYVNRQDFEMYSLEYIVDGRGSITLNDVHSDQGAGDVVLLHKHSKHVYSLVKYHSVEKIWIMLDGALINSFITAFRIGKSFIFKAPSCAENFYRIASYAKELSTNYPELRRKVITEVASIFAKISDKMTGVDNDSLGYKIKLLLDEQIYKKYNLELLAKSLSYSKNYIISAFKKEYNDTPFNYLINLKINSAKQYLAHSLLPISDISDKLQFSHCSYFCDIFKRKVACSPSEYRRKNYKNKQL